MWGSRVGVWIIVLKVIEPKGLLIYNIYLHAECMESIWKLSSGSTKDPVAVTCNWCSIRNDGPIGNIRIVNKTLPGWIIGGPIAFKWAITPINSDC